MHHFLLASWFLIRHSLLFKSLLPHKVLCCFTGLLSRYFLKGGEREVFSFQKFDYSVSGCGFLWVHTVWYLLSLLNLVVCLLSNLRCFQTLFLQIFFSLTLFLHSFWNSQEMNVRSFVWSHRSLRLCSFS